jgi:hypothetical protein
MLRCLLTLFLAFPVLASEPDAIVTLSPAPSPAQPPAPAPTPPADNVVGIKSYNWYGLNPKLDYKGSVAWRIEPVIELVDGKRVVQPGEVGLQKFKDAAKVFGSTRLSTDPVFSDVPAGAAVVWGKTPGKVTLVAWGVVGDEPKIVGTRILEVLGDVLPVPPGPGPGPTPVPPGPGPNPVKAKKLYMVVIRDPMLTSVEQATILADTDFWDSFKKAGHEWDIYTNEARDINGRETTQAKNKYLENVVGVTQPALLLIDLDTRRKITAVTLPKTKDDITNLIKENSKQ